MSIASKDSTTSKELGSESIKSVLEGLTDKELVKAVERLKRSNVRMEIECDIWINFIRKMEPRLLKGMDKILNYANIVASSTLPKLTSQLSLPHSGGIPQRAESLSSLASGQSSLSLRKSTVANSWLSGQIAQQKINIKTRTELAKREKERLENQIASFIAKSKIKRINLRAQLEELALQLAEIKEARDIFIQTICIEGIDPITGRIPAEKFIRYMEEWLKSADSIIEKLRLRTCTLHYKYIALRKQLTTKEELGEVIHPVDFDVMKIQNKILVKTIDDKNIDLLKLKQKLGEINLLLAKTVRSLHKQLKNKSLVQAQIVEAHNAIEKIAKECLMVQKEVKKSEKNLQYMKELKQNYTVPDLIEYIKVKKELEDLRKDIKIWTRRTHLQKVALGSCVKKMKSLTGTTQEQEAWFLPVPKRSDFSL